MRRKKLITFGTSGIKGRMIYNRMLNVKTLKKGKNEI